MSALTQPLPGIPERVANATQYIAAGITVSSGIDWNMVGVISGILIGVAGFAVNWHYQHKRFKLVEARAKRLDASMDIETGPAPL